MWAQWSWMTANIKENRRRNMGSVQDYNGLFNLIFEAVAQGISIFFGDVFYPISDQDDIIERHLKRKKPSKLMDSFL